MAIIYPHRRNLSAKELNWSQLWSLIRWTRVFWIGTALLDRLLFYPERRHLSRLTVPIQFADALRPHGHGMCLRLLGNGVIPQRHPHGHGTCTLAARSSSLIATPSTRAWDMHARSDSVSKAAASRGREGAYAQTHEATVTLAKIGKAILSHRAKIPMT